MTEKSSSNVWGYIQGNTTNYSGFLPSSKPGYSIFLLDTLDVWVEDPARTITITEIPTIPEIDLTNDRELIL